MEKKIAQKIHISSLKFQFFRTLQLLIRGKFRVSWPKHFGDFYLGEA